MKTKLEGDKPKASHLKVIKEEAAKFEDAGANAGVAKGCDEVVKIDAQGQWSIQKAAKEGPTLNYAEFNKPKEAKTTIDYSSGEPKITGEQWNSKDTTGIKAAPKRLAAKEARIRQAVKEGKVIDDRPKE